MNTNPLSFLHPANFLRATRSGRRPPPIPGYDEGGFVLPEDAVVPPGYEWLTQGATPPAPAPTPDWAMIEALTGRQVAGGRGGFAHGGFTGPGPKYQPAGIVHAGEFVIPKEKVAQFSIAQLDAMFGTDSTRPKTGYARGGFVPPQLLDGSTTPPPVQEQPWAGPDYGFKLITNDTGVQIGAGPEQPTANYDPRLRGTRLFGEREQARLAAQPGYSYSDPTSQRLDRVRAIAPTPTGAPNAPVATPPPSNTLPPQLLEPMPPRAPLPPAELLQQQPPRAPSSLPPQVLEPMPPRAPLPPLEMLHPRGGFPALRGTNAAGRPTLTQSPESLQAAQANRDNIMRLLRDNQVIRDGGFRTAAEARNSIPEGTKGQVSQNAKGFFNVQYQVGDKAPPGPQSSIAKMQADLTKAVNEGRETDATYLRSAIRYAADPTKKPPTQSQWMNDRAEAIMAKDPNRIAALGGNYEKFIANWTPPSEERTQPVLAPDVLLLREEMGLNTHPSSWTAKDREQYNARLADMRRSTAAATAPAVAAQPTTGDKYVVGRTYKDKFGAPATYLGNGKWEEHRMDLPPNKPRN